MMAKAWASVAVAVLTVSDSRKLETDTSGNTIIEAPIPCEQRYATYRPNGEGTPGQGISL